MEIISIEDCQKILSQLHENLAIKIITSKLQSGSTDLKGFFGDSYILSIKYEIENKLTNQTFFVKSFPASFHHAQMVKNLKGFEKEVFFYNFLVREFEKCGYNIDFVPKCYFCKDGKTIVMENLCEKNYKTDFFFSMNRTESCLKSLAFCHGASILYEEEMSKKFNRTFRLEEEYKDVFEEKFFDLDNEDNFIYKHFRVSLKAIEKLLDLIPEDVERKKVFLKYMKEKNIRDIFNKELGFRKVCSHGDLWRRNIMFQDDTDECKIIDFQMLRYFHPAFDVLSLLYFNLKGDLLKQHREDLLKYYYSCLSEATNQLVEDILPFNDFMVSVDHFEYLAIYQAAAGHTLDITNAVIDLFSEERVTYVVREFETVKQYREVLVYDLNLLMDCVFRKMV